MKRCAIEIDQAYVQERFHYDPASGIIRRRIATNRDNIYDILITYPKKSSGPEMGIKGRKLQVTYFIWLYCYGRFPTYPITILNGILYDMRLNNLRECAWLKPNQKRRLWPHTHGEEATKKYHGVLKEPGKSQSYFGNVSVKRGNHRVKISFHRYPVQSAYDRLIFEILRGSPRERLEKSFDELFGNDPVNTLDGMIEYANETRSYWEKVLNPLARRILRGEA